MKISVSWTLISSAYLLSLRLFFQERFLPWLNLLLSGDFLLISSQGDNCMCLVSGSQMFFVPLVDPATVLQVPY